MMEMRSYERPAQAARDIDFILGLRDLKRGHTGRFGNRLNVAVYAGEFRPGRTADSTTLAR